MQYVRRRSVQHTHCIYCGFLSSVRVGSCHMSLLELRMYCICLVPMSLYILYTYNFGTSLYLYTYKFSTSLFLYMYNFGTPMDNFNTSLYLCMYNLGTSLYFYMYNFASHCICTCIISIYYRICTCVISICHCMFVHVQFKYVIIFTVPPCA